MARADEGRGIEWGGLCAGQSNREGASQCDGGLHIGVEPDLVTTKTGILGALFCLHRVLIADCTPTSNRLCAVLLHQG